MIPDITKLAEIAERLADAAGRATLPWFRAAQLGLENKLEEADAVGTTFDPVTAADRAAEAAMRAVLAAERPDDAILGEEEGSTPGTTGLTWVLDPIDGTRAFLCGGPTWGVLIGLDDGTGLRLGVVDQPWTTDRWIGIPGNSPDGSSGDAPGCGAWHRARGGAARPIRTRRCAALGQAVMMTTDPRLFTAAERPAFDAIEGRVRLSRYGYDCSAYALLAMGQIDVVIESGLHAYDVGAVIPLVQAAGGVATDWKGGDARRGGRILAAGDPARHAELLEVLSEVP